jgi:hypothetical protein
MGNFVRTFFKYSRGRKRKKLTLFIFVNINFYKKWELIYFKEATCWNITALYGRSQKFKTLVDIWAGYPTFLTQHVDICSSYYLF